MNERIRQLSKEHFCRIEYDNGNIHECYEFSENELKEFAELLVLECVTAVMDGTKEGDHYAMRIEKHFDNGPGGILHYGDEESTVDQQLRNRSTYFGNNP